MDPQGITKSKQAPARLDAGNERFKAYGSELKSFYLTMGRYDIVAISEATDDAAAAKVALAIGSAGNISTQTLGAFTERVTPSISWMLDARDDGLAKSSRSGPSTTAMAS